MDDFNYAAGKIYLAARELATNPHDVKTRLLVAYNKYLVFADLQDDLRPHLEFIHKKMTAKGCEGPEGRWPSATDHTLYRMRKKNAVEIAEKIFQLHAEIEKRRWIKPRKRLIRGTTRTRVTKTRAS